ncbi:hypothetical protein [Actinoallomurus acaciae]|uniref:Uncharacterized protein n=1 Tax=Actinoallomurus acaciae TaxID=502577 RepID=A0ABV5Y9L2_9ACTN
MSNNGDTSTNSNVFGVELDPIYTLGNSWIEFGDRLTEHIHALTDAVNSMNWNGPAGSAMLNLWDGGSPFISAPPPPGSASPGGTVEGVLLAARNAAYEMGGQINAYADAVKKQIKKVQLEAIAEIIVGVIGAFAPFALGYIGWLGEAIVALDRLVAKVIDATLTPALRLLGVNARFSATVSSFVSGSITGATINTILTFSVEEIVHASVVGEPWKPDGVSAGEIVGGGALVGGLLRLPGAGDGAKSGNGTTEIGSPNIRSQEIPPPVRQDIPRPDPGGKNLGGPNELSVPPQRVPVSDVRPITESEATPDTGLTNPGPRNLMDGPSDLGRDSQTGAPSSEVHVPTPNRGGASESRQPEGLGGPSTVERAAPPPGGGRESVPDGGTDLPGQISAGEQNGRPDSGIGGNAPPRPESGVGTRGASGRVATGPREPVIDRTSAGHESPSADVPASGVAGGVQRAFGEPPAGGRGASRDEAPVGQGQPGTREPRNPEGERLVADGERTEPGGANGGPEPNTEVLTGSGDHAGAPNGPGKVRSVGESAEGPKDGTSPGVRDSGPRSDASAPTAREGSGESAAPLKQGKSPSPTGRDEAQVQAAERHAQAAEARARAEKNAGGVEEGKASDGAGWEDAQKTSVSDAVRRGSPVKGRDEAQVQAAERHAQAAEARARAEKGAGGGEERKADDPVSTRKLTDDAGKTETGKGSFPGEGRKAGESSDRPDAATRARQYEELLKNRDSGRAETAGSESADAQNRAGAPTGRPSMGGGRRQLIRTDLKSGESDLIEVDLPHRWGDGRRLGGPPTAGRAADRPASGPADDGEDQAGSLRYAEIDPRTGVVTETRLEPNAVVVSSRPLGPRTATRLGGEKVPAGDGSENIAVLDQAKGAWDVVTVAKATHDGPAPGNHPYETPERGPYQILQRDSDGNVDLLTYERRPVGALPEHGAARIQNDGRGQTSYHALDDSGPGHWVEANPLGTPTVERLVTAPKANRLGEAPKADGLKEAPKANRLGNEQTGRDEPGHLSYGSDRTIVLARDQSTGRYERVARLSADERTAGPTEQRYYRVAADGSLRRLEVGGEKLDIVKIAADRYTVERTAFSATRMEEGAKLHFGEDGSLRPSGRQEISARDLRFDQHSGEIKLIRADEETNGSQSHGGPGDDGGGGPGGTRPRSAGSRTTVTHLRTRTFTENRGVGRGESEPSGRQDSDQPGQEGRFPGEGRTAGESSARPDSAARADALERVAERSGPAVRRPDSAAGGRTRSTTVTRTENGSAENDVEARTPGSDDTGQATGGLGTRHGDGPATVTESTGSVTERTGPTSRPAGFKTESTAGEGGPTRFAGEPVGRQTVENARETFRLAERADPEEAGRVRTDGTVLAEAFGRTEGARLTVAGVDPGELLGAELVWRGYDGALDLGARLYGVAPDRLPSSETLDGIRQWATLDVGRADLVLAVRRNADDFRGAARELLTPVGGGRAGGVTVPEDQITVVAARIAQNSLTDVRAEAGRSLAADLRGGRHQVSPRSVAEAGTTGVPGRPDTGARQALVRPVGRQTVENARQTFRLAERADPEEARWVRLDGAALAEAFRNVEGAELTADGVDPEELLGAELVWRGYDGALDLGARLYGVTPDRLPPSRMLDDIAERARADVRRADLVLAARWDAGRFVDAARRVLAQAAGDVAVSGEQVTLVAARIAQNSTTDAMADTGRSLAEGLRAGEIRVQAHKPGDPAARSADVRLGKLPEDKYEEVMDRARTIVDEVRVLMSAERGSARPVPDLERIRSLVAVAILDGGESIAARLAHVLLSSPRPGDLADAVPPVAAETAREHENGSTGHEAGRAEEPARDQVEPRRPDPHRGPFARSPRPLPELVMGGGAGDRVEVPRVLHMVWLGASGLSDHARQNITAWRERAQRSGWTLTVWVDQDSREKDKEFLDTLRSAAVDVRVIVRDLFGNGERAASDGSAQWDVYRFASGRQGYAMASDVARLAILRRFGGVYVHTDIGPGVVTLPPEPLRMPVGRGSMPFMGPMLRDQTSLERARAHYAQRGDRLDSMAQAAQLYYDYGLFSNDFIVAPPNSVFLEELYQGIVEEFAARHTGPVPWLNKFSPEGPAAERRSGAALREAPDARPVIDPDMLRQWAGIEWITPESNRGESGSVSFSNSLDRQNLLAEAPSHQYQAPRPGLTTSEADPLRFDVRRVEHAGERLTEITIKLRLRPAEDVSAEQLEDVWRRQHMGVHRFFNSPRHRLPNGDLLAVNIVPAGADDPHLTVDVVTHAATMTPRTWVIGQPMGIYAHLVGHRLGLDIRSADGRRQADLRRPHLEQLGRIIGDLPIHAPAEAPVGERSGRAPQPILEDAQMSWNKSSFSQEHCVEVAAVSERIR